QIQELQNHGCEKIFTEKQSGKSFKNRPVYQEMRSKLRFGDTLIVHDLSRLGRDKEEIKREWQALIQEDIDIAVLNMPILDTRKYKDIKGLENVISNIVLELLSWMVDEERRRIREAQREGIEISKKQGEYKGRAVKYYSQAKGKNKIFYDCNVSNLQGGMSVMDIHLKTEFARNTIYRIK